MDANPPTAPEHEVPTAERSEVKDLVDEDILKDLSPEQLDALRNLFTYHSPTEGEKRKYEAINKAAMALAMVILVATPQCADQTAAIRLVRQARMTANAAIACRGAGLRY